MKTSEKLPHSSKAQILPFPLEKTREEVIDLSNIPISFPEELGTPPPLPVQKTSKNKGEDQSENQSKNQSKIEIESKSKNKSKSEGRQVHNNRLEYYQLPPFVLKMRRLSSLSHEIERLNKISLEVDYYLQEIENYSRKKNFDS